MAEPARPTAAEPQDLLRIIRSPEAPRELKAFAARGLLPLESDDRLRVLLAVAEDPDPEVGPAAIETLRATPQKMTLWWRWEFPSQALAASKEGKLLFRYSRSRMSCRPMTIPASVWNWARTT